ncbi:hypothetical protein PAXRUDRAFT_830091 [Paxillus rubicundulus Ve08.2h10]|uniref:Uncharacterized protein n=1 Tax=Paxillus rubicundulus Ve08.2h10 TaxID=930991 RepID=A0A0D0D671_9AGAM|nr:hypothetical protein PAXRUDRAFT_830091 [Paxillus rubicundulus Ve08.2h10]
MLNEHAEPLEVQCTTKGDPVTFLAPYLRQGSSLPRFGVSTSHRCTAYQLPRSSHKHACSAFRLRSNSIGMGCVKESQRVGSFAHDPSGRGLCRQCGIVHLHEGSNPVCRPQHSVVKVER